MQDSELSEAVRELIYTSVPDLDALELLIVLARSAGQFWSLEQLRGGIHTIKETELNLYLSLLVERRLVAASANGYAYQPTTPESAAAVAALLAAYDERPVTLVRTVYEMADQRSIQSFAEAFRLKKRDT